MTITYASAMDADIDIIFALNKDLIDKYEDTASIEYEKVLKWVYRKIKENIDDYNCVFLNGTKVGYYRFCPKNDGMELDDLYIFPSYQNMGLGTEIIRKCISQTNLPIMLYVFVKNEGAVRLYQKLGFQITSRVHETRYIMQRNP